MKWPFKTKEIDSTTIRLADTINRKNGTRLVNYHDSTYYCKDLSFFGDFKLYTYIDLGFIPYYQVKLLDNGYQTIYLDGTIAPFIEAASISPLVLTRQTVFDYAKIVLSCLEKDECSYHLVYNIDEVDFNTEPTPDQLAELENCIHPPIISRENGSFHLSCTIIHTDKIFEAELLISPNGRLDIVNQILLLEDMPVKELIFE